MDDIMLIVLAINTIFSLSILYLLVEVRELKRKINCKIGGNTYE